MILVFLAGCFRLLELFEETFDRIVILLQDGDGMGFG